MRRNHPSVARRENPRLPSEPDRGAQPGRREEGLRPRGAHDAVPRLVAEAREPQRRVRDPHLGRRLQLHLRRSRVQAAREGDARRGHHLRVAVVPHAASGRAAHLPDGLGGRPARRPHRALPGGKARVRPRAHRRAGLLGRLAPLRDARHVRPHARVPARGRARRDAVPRQLGHPDVPGLRRHGRPDGQEHDGRQRTRREAQPAAAWTPIRPSAPRRSTASSAA